MVDEITADELHERIETGDPVQVIDVRSEPAYRRGHIPDAENVPLTRFTDAIEDREWNDEIVVACPHGESSLQAARLLEAYEGTDEGTRIANLVDGYDGWQHDLESDADAPDRPGHDAETTGPPF
jgi:rhodanese-related sulfurtransferase